MTLDLAIIVRATGAHVWRLTASGELLRNSLHTFDLKRTFQSVCVDSREVTPRALFFALRGERTDGQEFVGAAMTAGAAGCVVSESAGEETISAALHAAPSGTDAYVFQAPDTLRALQELAAHWRDQHDLETIGITGSIGKTTTKEMVAGILATHTTVLRSEGNRNTEIGLPLTLLALEHKHRIGVFEMGMYVPGDIALLATLARPRIGIVTNVAPIHLERAGSLERIARAKSELVAALPADGVAILNGDDVWTRAMAVTSGIAPSILVGFAQDCAYRASDVIANGLHGVSFTLHAEDRHIPLRTSIPGVHLIHSLLVACATARMLGMEWDSIQAAVASVRLENRQKVLRPRRGLVVIDDSYNAAPLSMNAALELLRVSPGEKIAVLGDMLELGPHEEEAHREVGERAAEVADWLVVCGTRGGWIADEAIRKGLPRERVLRTESNQKATEAIFDILSTSRSAVRPGSPASHQTCDEAQWSVLVKGSRGMVMEEVVQGLQVNT